jgi:hypothetical protein
MPDQIYSAGDFYQCQAATSAGESPVTAAVKWTRLDIPKRWRWVLTRLTYAHLLDLDGQGDKAAAERALAQGRMSLGLDDLIRTAANSEGWRNRPCVNSGFPER